DLAGPGRAPCVGDLADVCRAERGHPAGRAGRRLAGSAAGLAGDVLGGCGCRRAGHGRGGAVGAGERRRGRTGVVAPGSGGAGARAGAAGAGDHGGGLCRRIRGIHLYPAVAGGRERFCADGGVAGVAGLRRRHDRGQSAGRASGRPAPHRRVAGQPGGIGGGAGRDGPGPAQQDRDGGVRRAAGRGRLRHRGAAAVARARACTRCRPEPGLQSQYRRVQSGQCAGRLAGRCGDRHACRPGRHAVGCRAVERARPGHRVVERATATPACRRAGRVCAGGL
ncbi:hypothetical protein XPR_0868, partial [Xanthomonas arboricola pv. pruni MAFF 301420]